MNYFQITLPLPQSEEASEILIAQLAAIDFESFEEKRPSLIAYIPEKDFTKQRLLEIVYCHECENLGQLKIELIPDQNWNEVWESNYPSVTIAERCYIRADFHNSIPSMEYEIIITPKMAFGTAHHETTSMMLELILNNNFNNCKVLDMGCGTGVLAILASMKGAISITAIDIDKWSYESTLENTILNNISNVNVMEGGAELVSQSGNHDIIFANINKNILLRDMKYYIDTLVDGGHIYFSGFYKHDLGDIIDEAGNNGLKFVSNLEKNNWIAAVFIKQK
ncbi:MAG: 50S ribosomal protein L11 methyltransferase [Bacteroidota bacterium]